MRKLMLLSVLSIVAAAGGCNCCRNMCGGWQPGQHLFGARQPQYQPAPYQYGYAPMNECYDPCATGGVMAAPMMAAPMANPCCNP